MVRRFSLAAACKLALPAALLAAAPLRAQAADSAATTTLGKVYTDVQAAKGKDAFGLTCLSCHKPSELSGQKFWAGMVGKTVSDFFTYVRGNMPQDNPGSLSDDDYANVTAYILQLNGMPAGERPLPGDSTALAKIRIVPTDTAKKGPTR